MPFVICALVFGSLALAGHSGYFVFIDRIRWYLKRKAERQQGQLDDVFVRISQERLQRLYLMAPIGLGLIGWLGVGHIYAGFIGAGIGLLVPQFVLRFMKAQRSRRFYKQFVDALLLLSSCLRAGLSLLQSFTVVTEEMPAPISEEFGLVLKEARMGVSITDALAHFRERMPTDDTILFVTALLVARETGGNLTEIFTRLVDTLRGRRKIAERIKTLTFMAKMQGLLMAALPIIFSFVIYQMDPDHLKFFTNDPDGKLILAGVIAIQTLGMFLFARFSRSPL